MTFRSTKSSYSNELVLNLTVLKLNHYRAVCAGMLAHTHTTDAANKIDEHDYTHTDTRLRIICDGV